MAIAAPSRDKVLTISETAIKSTGYLYLVRLPLLGGDGNVGNSQHGENEGLNSTHEQGEKDIEKWRQKQAV
jgi:hypothetical protein